MAAFTVQQGEKWDATVGVRRTVLKGTGETRARVPAYVSEYAFHSVWTQKELKALIGMVLKEHGLKPVPIQFRAFRGRRFGTAQYGLLGGGRIILSAPYPSVALHEAVHLVTRGHGHDKVFNSTLTRAWRTFGRFIATSSKSKEYNYVIPRGYRVPR